MKISRNITATCIWLFVLGGLGAATKVSGSPITYTFTATGSGTIGTTPFTDALVTVTAIGDTSTIFEAAAPPYAPDTFFDPTQVVVSISKVGTAAFIGTGYIDGYGPLANGYVFDNQTESLAGFGIESDAGDVFGSSAFATYNLSSSIGPISSVSMDFSAEATTLGALTLTGVTPGTFTAAVGSSVPEPATGGMVALALAAALIIKPRRNAAKIVALSSILVASSASAWAGSCLGGITGSMPTFSVSSTVGNVADFTLTCSNPSGSMVESYNFDFILNAAILDTGAWSLTQGANAYAGTYVFPNEVDFASVAYDSSLPTLSFTVQGVDVNPSASAPGFLYDELVQIVAGTSPPLTAGQTLQLVATNGIISTPEPSVFVSLSIGLGIIGVLRFKKRTG